jgi:hypothetical protein
MGKSPKMAQSNDYLNRLWIWTKGQIVQEVPEDIAHCAFECQKEKCTVAEWENCERRTYAARRTSEADKIARI